MDELPSSTPPAGAAASASDLLLALARLHEASKVAIKLDFKRLNHMDSPVGVEADSNLWAYAVLALTLLAWWRVGWEVALAIAVVGVVAYYTAGRAYVRRRLERRVVEKALGDLDTWRKLWRFGGVALVPRDGEPCIAPEGNWMALVRSLDVTSPGR
jgi:hypothetical protein